MSKGSPHVSFRAENSLKSLLDRVSTELGYSESDLVRHLIMCGLSHEMVNSDSDSVKTLISHYLSHKDFPTHQATPSPNQGGASRKHVLEEDLPTISTDIADMENISTTPRTNPAIHEMVRFVHLNRKSSKATEEYREKFDNNHESKTFGIYKKTIENNEFLHEVTVLTKVRGQKLEVPMYASIHTESSSGSDVEEAMLDVVKDFDLIEWATDI